MQESLLPAGNRVGNGLRTSQSSHCLDWFISEQGAVYVGCRRVIRDRESKVPWQRSSSPDARQVGQTWNGLPSLRSETIILNPSFIMFVQVSPFFSLMRSQLFIQSVQSAGPVFNAYLGQGQFASLILLPTCTGYLAPAGQFKNILHNFIRRVHIHCIYTTRPSWWVSICAPCLTGPVCDVAGRRGSDRNSGNNKYTLWALCPPCHMVAGRGRPYDISTDFWLFHSMFFIV